MERFQGSIRYGHPPLVTPFLAQRAFSRLGGGGYFEAPLRQEFYPPPPFYTPPRPTRVFSPGVGRVYKFGPVKVFFSLARNRLGHDEFNQFLASIKRLNNSQQSQEDTLQEVRRIFGAQNQDLYSDFQSLLSRHGL